MYTLGLKKKEIKMIYTIKRQYFLVWSILFLTNFLSASEYSDEFINILRMQERAIYQEVLTQKMYNLQSGINSLDNKMGLACIWCNLPWQNAKYAKEYKELSLQAVDTSIVSHEALENECDIKWCRVASIAEACFVEGFVIPSVCINSTIIPSLIGAPVCCVISSYASYHAIELEQVKKNAETQLAIKQLYLTGKVNEKYKNHLRKHKNAFYMKDRHGNIVYDR